MSECEYMPVDKSQPIQAGDEFRVGVMEWTKCDGITLGMQCFNDKCEHRRPIKQMQAGQGESDMRSLAGLELTGRKYAGVEDMLEGEGLVSPGIRVFYESQIAELRTLTAAQSKALDAAHKYLMLERHPYMMSVQTFAEYEKKRIVALNEALAEITAAKEVGK